MENVSSTLLRKKSVTAKKAMTNRTKSEFTSHCRIAAKMNFLMLLLFPARFAHARYSCRMIDRFLNWGDHGKPKSGKIKGRCQPPLVMINYRKDVYHHSWVFFTNTGERWIRIVVGESLKVAFKLLREIWWLVWIICLIHASVASLLQVSKLPYN